jgi:MscS family membrane protein
MMQDFLTQTFYGNTVAAWAIALTIAVVSVIVGKTVYWVASRVVRKATSRTETTVDDFLLDTIDEPIVVIVTVIGFWIGVQTLTLPAGAESFLWASTQAALVLAVTWMLARLWDSFVLAILKPLVESSDTDLDDQLLPIVLRGGKSALWI